MSVSSTLTIGAIHMTSHQLRISEFYRVSEFLNEIEKNSGMNLHFGKAQVIEDFDTITWEYIDDPDHGLGEGSDHFKVEVDVKPNSEGAFVDVNFNCIQC